MKNQNMLALCAASAIGLLLAALPAHAAVVSYVVNYTLGGTTTYTVDATSETGLSFWPRVGSSAYQSYLVEPGGTATVDSLGFVTGAALGQQQCINALSTDWSVTNPSADQGGKGTVVVYEYGTKPEVVLARLTPGHLYRPSPSKHIGVRSEGGATPGFDGPIITALEGDSVVAFGPLGGGVFPDPNMEYFLLESSGSWHVTDNTLSAVSVVTPFAGTMCIPEPHTSSFIVVGALLLALVRCRKPLRTPPLQTPPFYVAGPRVSGN